MSEDDAGPTYRLSTHEDCDGPCSRLRERAAEHPDVEFKGAWGPFVETIDGTTVALGHDELERFFESLEGED